MPGGLEISAQSRRDLRIGRYASRRPPLRDTRNESSPRFWCRSPTVSAAISARRKGALNSAENSPIASVGERLTSHGRYVTFQMAEVAMARQIFGDTLVTDRSAPDATC